jgi:nucleotide-binding universal stress UspA family protein
MPDSRQCGQRLRQEISLDFQIARNDSCTVTWRLEATMIKVRTVLVPTDFSDCSDAAVKYGYAVAEALGATLHLLHVVQVPSTMPWATDGFAAPLGETITDWETRAQHRLVETVDEASPAPTVLRTLVGSPHSAIVGYAEQQRVDLIVLGTHGRGPLGHVLLGSVAERVIRAAPCPVLTVRHPLPEFVTEGGTDDSGETVTVAS